MRVQDVIKMVKEDGWVMCIAKDRKVHISYLMQQNHEGGLFLPESLIDEILKIVLDPNTIGFHQMCKTEEEDKVEVIRGKERVIKAGWKSKGWPGEVYDIYRMVQ